MFRSGFTPSEKLVVDDLPVYNNTATLGVQQLSVQKVAEVAKTINSMTKHVPAPGSLLVHRIALEIEIKE